MKKLIFCAALFAAITFAACSDDESNLPATPANIVGTWKIVHEQGYSDYDGPWSDDYPDVDDGYYWTVTFNEGGTGKCTEYQEGESPASWRYSYSISGNILTIKGDTNDDDWWEIAGIYRIDALTKSQLVLFESSDYYDDYESGDSSWEETTTYKRIQ